MNLDAKAVAELADAAAAMIVAFERPAAEMLPIQVHTSTRLHAAITALEQSDAEREQPWKPIETAPKDGTRILLWIEPTKIAMPFEWNGERWMGDDYPLNMAWPTHWQPMPEPPERLSSRPGNEGSKS